MALTYTDVCQDGTGVSAYKENYGCKCFEVFHMPQVTVTQIFAVFKNI